MKGKVVVWPVQPPEPALPTLYPLSIIDDPETDTTLLRTPDGIVIVVNGRLLTVERATLNVRVAAGPRKEHSKAVSEAVEKMIKIMSNIYGEKRVEVDVKEAMERDIEPSETCIGLGVNLDDFERMVNQAEPVRAAVVAVEPSAKFAALVGPDRVLISIGSVALSIDEEGIRLGEITPYKDVLEAINKTTVFIHMGCGRDGSGGEVQA